MAVSPACQNELKASLGVVEAGSDIAPRFVLTTVKRGKVVAICQWHENAAAQVDAFAWLRDFFAWLDVVEFVFSVELITPSAAAVMRVVRNLSDCEMVVQPIRAGFGAAGNPVEMTPDRIDPVILALLPRGTASISEARQDDLEAIDDALEAATHERQTPLLMLRFGIDGRPKVETQ